MCDPAVRRRSARTADESKKPPSTADELRAKYDTDATGPVGGANGPRFDGPEPVQPCTRINLAHHVVVFAAIAYSLVTHGCPSLGVVAFMLWYADAYTAVLHAALDRPGCLYVKILHGAARGFQAHHDYPLASTHGRGCYRMICDTQRIQTITIVSALVFGRWNVATFQICLMKLLFSAYGGATGHFYAHGGAKPRGPAIKLAQKCHMLLPPKHHVGGHHAPPHDKNFGIFNGLSNYALNPFLGAPMNPPLGVLLAAWAALSLFDVAVVERCVGPVGEVVGRGVATALELARSSVSM